MQTGEVKGRYCLIEPAKGPVSVVLYAGKNIAAGGDFALYEAGGNTVKENFKLSVDNDNNAIFELKAAPDKLNKTSLAWQILCCSTKPGLNEGKIKVIAIQEKKACKITLPAEWHLNNIPPCSINSPEKISGTMVFVIRT